MDRTQIATRAIDAATALDRIYDEATLADSTPPLPGLGMLTAAVDHIAGIFEYDGDDEITDAVLKAIDKLAYVARLTRDLARAKLTVDRNDMLDPSLEYLRLLRDAEDRAVNGETPDRVNALLHIADRYLADALRSAYQRRKTADAGTTPTETDEPRATLRPATADPTPVGMADLRVPEHVAHAILGVRGAVVAGRTNYNEADVDGLVTQRITQAAMLHGAGVTPRALAVFLQIAANGRVRAVDVESLNAALDVDPTDPRAARADFDNSLDGDKNLPQKG